MSEVSRGEGASNEEDSDDGLWGEFETCAQAVAHLFRGANWRNLQTAAASTTQLYKSGLDSKKRSFEKGFNAGRQSLAKELFGLCRYSTKIDVEDVVTLLSRYTALPEQQGLSPRRQRNAAASNAVNSSSTPVGEGHSAVNLFQQALCPAESPSYRAPELNNFLQNQLYRHRKRPHSPGTQSSANSTDGAAMSPSSMLSKRFKRLQ